MRIGLTLYCVNRSMLDCIYKLRKKKRNDGKIRTQKD